MSTPVERLSCLRFGIRRVEKSSDRTKTFDNGRDSSGSGEAPSHAKRTVMMYVVDTSSSSRGSSKRWRPRSSTRRADSERCCKRRSSEAHIGEATADDISTYSCVEVSLSSAVDCFLPLEHDMLQGRRAGGESHEVGPRRNLRRGDHGVVDLDCVEFRRVKHIRKLARDEGVPSGTIAEQ